MSDESSGPLDFYDGFEWDEVKRLQNVAKQGIDFADACQVFDDPHAWVCRSAIAIEEPRYLIIGRVGARTIAVVFTRRRSLVRLISARPSRRNERQIYDAQLTRE